MAVYLIQGFFFQNREEYGIAHLAEVEGGVHAVVRQELWRTMFAGIIFPENDGLIGQMEDRVGESTLSGVMISPNEVSFFKKYVGRTDSIRYNFKLEKGIWTGKYYGTYSNGDANCIITEVSESIFSPLTGNVATQSQG